MQKNKSNKRHKYRSAKKAYFWGSLIQAVDAEILRLFKNQNIGLGVFEHFL